MTHRVNFFVVVLGLLLGGCTGQGSAGIPKDDGQRGTRTEATKSELPTEVNDVSQLDAAEVSVHDASTPPTLRQCCALSCIPPNVP